MSFFKEFREFALKGNVMDMAVGVIIGGAFGKIVSSLVNDILMPPIGALIGNTDFSSLRLDIQDRGRGKIRQIFQVFLGQVAAGKDQVDPLQPLPCAVIPQCFGGGIRNRKYLHVRNAPFC